MKLRLKEKVLVHSLRHMVEHLTLKVEKKFIYLPSTQAPFIVEIST